jgi:hypothetical protein
MENSENRLKIFCVIRFLKTTPTFVGAVFIYEWVTGIEGAEAPRHHCSHGVKLNIIFLKKFDFFEVNNHPDFSLLHAQNKNSPDKIGTIFI